MKLENLPPRLRLWGEDKDLEEFFLHKAFVVNPLPKDAPMANGKVKIAVVGSGPAGLGSCDELLRLGFEVTVFERDDRPGGLLMYGVPNIKLEKTLVLEKVAELKAKGANFQFNTEVGKDITLAELEKEFAATIVCVGSTAPRQLKSISQTGEGIYYAKDFLSKVTQDMLDGASLTSNLLQDKDVLIVGGGDTGIDCAAIAFASSAKSIHQIELRDCEMTDKTQAGFCEMVQGDQTLAYNKRLEEVILSSAGQVSAAKLVDVAWVSPSPGSLPQAQVIAGSEQEIAVQVVLLATGFTGPEPEVFTNLGLKKTPIGTIAKGTGYFDTSVSGVFAAGDARRGQGVVEWAFAEGRNAATECAQYLKNLETKK